MVECLLISGAGRWSWTSSGRAIPRLEGIRTFYQETFHGRVRAIRSLLSALHLRRAPAGLAPVIIGMAAARQGVWLSVDPGPEFSAAYKNMSFAEELDVPLDVLRDLALKAKLVG